MKTKSKKELCKGYGVTYPTLKKMMRKVKGLKSKLNDKIIFEPDLIKIYSIYGNPFKESESK